MGTQQPGVGFGIFKTTAKTVVLICFTVFVVIPAFFGCLYALQDWRFTRFAWRGQQYFAQVAEVCDHLAADAKVEPREIQGHNLQALPAVLRELGPDRVIVTTNCVMLVAGGGFVGHKIIWAADPSNKSWWNLKICGNSPDEGKRLFSKFKPGGT